MIKSKLNRTNFYDDFNNNGIAEKVLDSDYYKLFKMNFKPTIYIIKDVDIARWDMISFKHYRSYDFYWIILKVNNINDPWNDIEPGDEIIIPDKRDVYDFYTAVKNSKRDCENGKC